MKDAADDDTSALIPAGCKLHRALLRSGLYEKQTGKILSASFMRRRDADQNLAEKHASVADARYRRAEDFTRLFNSCKGVVQFNVDSAREVNLDAIPAPTEKDAYHALIHGMPDDVVEEERLASVLATASTWEWRP